MPLTIGTRLGSHEIIALLGKGRMGEVYRARDLKLKREVAIKILPEEFARDADRVSRFQREAEVLALLNHPNIAAIYDLQAAEDTRFLVLELVEGETLAERIQRASIPFEEALELTKNICDALEAAHDRGVVHRDLKPANVKITPDGKVKVLDFGLAKAMESRVATASVSNSPTLLMTGATGGVIIGTVAYMSPEQARGRVADRRSDIFAFGCVLYEMLTGRQAFQGEEVSDVLASVLKSEPDFGALPADVNPEFKTLLRRCFEKDPKRRWQCAGDLRAAIDDVLSNPHGTAEDNTRSGRRILPWSIAIAALLLAAATIWLQFKPRELRPLLRANMDLGAVAELLGAPPAMVLSPDAKVFGFVGKTATEKPRMYIRRLDQLEATVLAGTENARNPFFSPDGQWIGFFAEGKLKKISTNGGAPVTLCDAPNDRGGSWGEDEFIVFAPDSRTGLSRVSAYGGTPEPITKLAGDEVTHRWPQVLQGGRFVLFTASPSQTDYDKATISVQPVAGGERKNIQRGGSFARVLPSGHLLFGHQTTIFGAAFDQNKLELTSQPVPVLEGVAGAPTANGAMYFAIANDGSAVYLAGGIHGPDLSLNWMQQDGKTLPFRQTTGFYQDLRFSPDGKRLAMSMNEGQYDIWIYEWARDTMSRLTSDPALERFPVWSPDSLGIAFTSQRADRSTGSIYWQRADGTGEPQRLTEAKPGRGQLPMSWHPSGKFLAFRQINPETKWDIMMLPLDGNEKSGWKPGQPTAFVATPFNDADPAFSPDGRWIAYQSDESGKFEIYVQPFPGPGGRWQISTGGGEYATWSKTTKELFYRTADQHIMVARYTTAGDSFQAERPTSWSSATFTDRGTQTRNFDLHPDGKRFVVVKSAMPNEKFDRVVLMLNFFDELRRVIH